MIVYLDKNWEYVLYIKKKILDVKKCQLFYTI